MHVQRFEIAATPIFTLLSTAAERYGKYQKVGRLVVPLAANNGPRAMVALEE
jgi:hypothetical protein